MCTLAPCEGSVHHPSSVAVVAAIVALVVVQRTRAAEAEVWRELSPIVPTQALTPAEAQFTNDLAQSTA